VLKTRVRQEIFGELHNILDDLVKHEKTFWRHFRVHSNIFEVQSRINLHTN